MTFIHEWTRIYILQVANLCQGKTRMWIRFTSAISIYPIQMQRIRDIQGARNSCSCVYVWIYPIRTYVYVCTYGDDRFSPRVLVIY